MIRFILRRIIGENAPRERYGTVAGKIGIFLNLLLFALKLSVGMLTASIAITADAVNSLSDAASSLVTIFGFYLAGKKADREHPFGHGRIEYIAGMAVSVVIIVVGIELAKSSIDGIINPTQTQFSLISLAVLIFSALVKLWMFFFCRSISKKINSSALASTAKDSLSDVAATSAVLIGALVSLFAGVNIDGWLGIIVSVFIIFTGIGALKDTLNPLLGAPPSSEFIDSLRHEFMQYPLVYGIHDIIVHNYGVGKVMVMLHAEVPAERPVGQLHDMLGEISQDIEEKLDCELLVHMDPVAHNFGETERYKCIVSSILASVDPQLAPHGFTLDLLEGEPIAYFEIAIPFDYPVPEHELMEQILNQAQKTKDAPKMNFKIEHPYS